MERRRSEEWFGVGRGFFCSRRFRVQGLISVQWKAEGHVKNTKLRLKKD